MSKKPHIKPDRTYKTKITYTCPVRGQVTEEVEVKVYRQADSYNPIYSCDEVAELLRQEGVLPVEES